MLVLAATCVRAQSLDSTPQYQPGQTVSGTIRVWGNERMATLMKYWQEGFHKYHRDVQFETRLIGTGTGMAGLYTSVADLALMGRESTSSESMAFEWVFRYKPLGVEVATGSLDVPGKTFALAVLVHKDNPLSRLTLTQLDAVFGSEHLRGPRNIRTWGDLGLTGEWKDKPINTYGFDIETGTGGFFKRVVLNGSDKWSCDLREFADVKRPNGSLLDGGQRILDALAQDRYGIAYSNLRYVNRRVKPVAVAADDAGPYYDVTKENLVQRKYPLARAISIYLNRAPGKPVDPKVKEFLRYVLSREGQQDVVREGDFLPLSAEAIRAQLSKLD
ncbi:MAG: phosphate transport system substrate-binding protein [Acidobacteriota bacterium]|nr:phosphate transport system substrate-binding protein [Acidobacteriota bacterium]